MAHIDQGDVRADDVLEPRIRVRLFGERRHDGLGDLLIRQARPASHGLGRVRVPVVHVRCHWEPAPAGPERDDRGAAAEWGRVHDPMDTRRLYTELAVCRRSHLGWRNDPRRVLYDRERGHVCDPGHCAQRWYRCLRYDFRRRPGRQHGLHPRSHLWWWGDQTEGEWLFGKLPVSA